MKNKEKKWRTEKVKNNKEAPEENQESKTEGKKKEKSWVRNEGKLAVDIYETEKDVVIQAPVAGVKKNDLEIVTEKDMVVIKGKRERPEKDEIKNFYTEECFFGEFKREVILPEETDPSRIEADMEDGVLTIRAPKIEKEKKRKIDV